MYEKAKKNDKDQQAAKKGWQVASEDMGRGSPAGSLSETLQFNRGGLGGYAAAGAGVRQDFEQKITIKRNE